MLKLCQAKSKLTILTKVPKNKVGQAGAELCQAQPQAVLTALAFHLLLASKYELYSWGLGFGFLGPDGD